MKNLLTLICLIVALSGCKNEIEDRPPNLLFIMMDDLGYGQFVRGYTSGSFETNTAFQDFQDRLLGSKLALASAEVRLPLLGVPQLGLLSFPYLPTELVFFADAG